MKIFNFEFDKLRYRRKTLKSLLIVIPSFFLVVLVVFFLLPISTYNTPSSMVEQVEVYQHRLDTINNQLQSDDLFDFEIEDLQSQKMKLEYLIKTESYEYDYLDIDDFLQKHMLHTRASFAIFIQNILFWFMIVLSIVISIYVFGYDITNGTIKNIFASNQARKNIYFGKLKFQFFILFAIIITLLLITFVIGLTDSKAMFLMFNDNGYYALSIMQVLLFYSISIVLVTVIVSLLTNLLIIVSRSSSDTIQILVWFLIIEAIVFFFVNKSIMINNLYNTVNSHDYILIFNLDYYFKHVQIKTFYWTLLYIIIVCVLSLLQRRKFIKMDY